MHQVYQHSQEGLHVVTRSDPYWANLSQYLVIEQEQVLMRSLINNRWVDEGKWNDGDTASGLVAVYHCLLRDEFSHARADINELNDK